MLQIYALMFFFFSMGAIGFWRINRKKSRLESRRNWLKYFTYFVIINLVYLSMAFRPLLFHYLTLFILLAGLLEIIHLFTDSGWQKPIVFSLAFLIYAAFAAFFYYFGLLDSKILVFTFLITAVFDAFCQISGQLLGKQKIFPKVSPNKTAEGFFGGAMVAIFTSLLLQNLLDHPWPQLILLTTGIIIFAFLGDLLTSWYKRQYRVKDFSNIIPGHGGFLDRFDSLIAAGAFISLISFLNF